MALNDGLPPARGTSWLARKGGLKSLASIRAAAKAEPFAGKRLSPSPPRPRMDVVSDIRGDRAARRSEEWAALARYCSGRSAPGGFFLGQGGEFHGDPRCTDTSHIVQLHIMWTGFVQRKPSLGRSCESLPWIKNRVVRAICLAMAFRVRVKKIAFFRFFRNSFMM